jgi:hypothetical protein
LPQTTKDVLTEDLAGQAGGKGTPQARFEPTRPESPSAILDHHIERAHREWKETRRGSELDFSALSLLFS